MVWWTDGSEFISRNNFFYVKTFKNLISFNFIIAKKTEQKILFNILIKILFNNLLTFFHK